MSEDYNGEPGCQTLEEVNQMFRNFFDPTTYWQCEVQGKPATKKRCPSSMLFSDKSSQCIHYSEWQWTEPKLPPSQPKK